MGFPFVSSVRFVVKAFWFALSPRRALAYFTITSFAVAALPPASSRQK